MPHQQPPPMQHVRPSALRAWVHACAYACAGALLAACSPFATPPAAQLPAPAADTTAMAATQTPAWLRRGTQALHIVPQPEKALQEIKRVLKEGGVLIAPTFTHAGNSFSGKVKAFFMKLAGFPLHSRWTSAEYLRFLSQNGWAVRKSAVLKASFPLTYAECVKSEV